MSSPSAPFISVRVSELYEKPKRPGRFVVALSSGERVTVSIGVLADLGATRVGAELQEAAVLRLMRESRVIAAMDRSVASLARGRRSRRELEQRLKRVEPDSAVVQEAMDRLSASGIVSDDAVARDEASARLRRGEAPARVQERLRRKGIDGDLAVRAVRDAVRDDVIDEAALCRRAAEKRMRALKSLEPRLARRRLIAFLMRRGFSSAAVFAALADHFESR